MNYKEFIKKNKKLIIGILAFVLLNVTILLAWKITHSKDEEISPSAEMNNSTETNNNQPSTETEQSNTIQKQEADGTIIIYDRNTEKIIKKIFTNGTIQEFENEVLIKEQFAIRNGEICEYNPQTKLLTKVTTLKSDGSKKPLIVSDFDSKTGNKLKQTNYRLENDNIEYIIDFNPGKADRKKKITHFKVNGAQPSIVLEYDETTGNKLKQTEYRKDNEKIEIITDYDPSKEDKKRKITSFKADGISPSVVLEYDEQHGYLTSQTKYRDNSPKIEHTTLYDPANQDKKTQFTQFKIDGLTPSIHKTYYSNSGYIQQETQFHENIDKKKKVIDYNPATKGQKTKETLLKEDGIKHSIVLEFDPTTGNKLRQTKYRDNSDKIEQIINYNPATNNFMTQVIDYKQEENDKPLVMTDYHEKTQNKLRQTKYRDTTDTIEAVIDYNPEKKDQKTKETIFKGDGINHSIVLEFDPITGNKKQETHYQTSNNCVNFVIDYNPAIQDKKTKITNFKADGKTPLTVLTFDENTGNKLEQKTYQNENNIIRNIINFNPETENKKINYTEFKANGTNISAFLTFDPNTGNRLQQKKYNTNNDKIAQIIDYNPSQDQLLNKITDFKADGETPSKVTEFNDKGKKEKYIQYKDDENIIELTKEYDPTTDKLIKEIEFKGDGINPLIMSIYDKDTSNIIEYREYQDEANLIECLYTYNPNIQERKKQEKHFKSDGTSLSIVVDFDADTGNKKKITRYKQNENKIASVEEYDPTTQAKITTITYQDDGITIKETKRH
ncbi:DUF2963 domain-containing protein [Candidatus Phytoplasma pruni]|uniref:DUF2963 domain-containing protein n=1 Tax=Candidatus Phytoplasma pruni TaxID=479893 RepID=A0A851HJR6_9MOLU|nr:DUF2963 domain-containing protein [Candidatus Phytoplasma pruni]NWN45679.1 DUF2963 domain-containing protein [Candidatus Phytoplasma pruni]